MKLLIIEGPDNVGKSRLINDLCKQASNHIVRHFGGAKGQTDMEKRNFQFQFFKKEFELASSRSVFDMPDNVRYPRDLYILDRAHLGEFVYGKIYRNTNPEQWVMQLEELYGFNLDPSIYLLMLTAPAQFLINHDDGLSDTLDVTKKQLELDYFYDAFDNSKIINKKILDVSNGNDYLDKDIIFDRVNNFLNFI